MELWIFKGKFNLQKKGDRKRTITRNYNVAIFSLTATSRDLELKITPLSLTKFLL